MGEVSSKAAAVSVHGSKVRTLATPNVTPIQKVALVMALVNLVRVFGLDISDEQVDAIKDATEAVLIVGGLEAIVRGARAIGTRGVVPTE